MASTFGNNLIDKLVPMVDSLRSSLNTAMGTRQFRVYRVMRTWAGGEVGVGAVSVNYATEVTPTPAVAWESREYRLGAEHGTGLVDSGMAVLTEVTLTLTAAELLGLPRLAGQEFYYRIIDGKGQGIATTHWVPKGHPEPDREQGIGWIVRLTRYDAAE